MQMPEVKKSTKSKTFSQNDKAKRVRQSGRNCEVKKEKQVYK